MSSRIRFTEAADVFAAFPGLERMAARPSGPLAPLDYARSAAASARPAPVLAFLAHLLPRREAVWWACKGVAAISTAYAQQEGMRLALRWVREPDEPNRREALAFTQTADLNQPTNWLARAAAYSGGSLLAPEQPNAPPPPEACALAVNAALVLAAASQPPALVFPWMRALAEAGVRFAAGEEAKVEPPV